MSPICVRCELSVSPGDLVVDVRVVTSHPTEDGGVRLATDRTDRVAHARCPGETSSPFAGLALAFAKSADRTDGNQA